MARKSNKNNSTKRQESSLSARQRHQERQQKTKKERVNQNRLLIGSGVFLIVMIAGFGYLGNRTVAGVEGEQSFATLGNNHIQYGQRSPIDYNSTPPSSGPHYGNLAAWDVYEEPIRYEQVVHNMEDGGVVVYYQCEEACPELVEQLTETVQPYIDAGRHVLLAPNQPEWTVGGGQPLHEDMDAKIALTAWTKVLKLNEFDADQIDHFIRRYEGIDHHLRG